MDNKEAIKALSFFRSVIKSGESWTPHCEAAYDKALASLQSEPVPDRVEEGKPKPKTLSNAKAPGPGQGIPKSVGEQRLDPEFLAETMGRVEEVWDKAMTIVEAVSGNFEDGDAIAACDQIIDAMEEAKRIVQPTGIER